MSKEIITVYVDDIKVNHAVYESPENSDGLIRIRKARGYIEESAFPSLSSKDQTITYFIELGKRGGKKGAFMNGSYFATFQEAAKHAMDEIHRRHKEIPENIVPVLLDN